MNEFRPLLIASLILLSIILLAYTASRAGKLSITHDESTTYNWFQDTNVFTCFVSRACWPNANNHLLNTFLWQESVALFGVSEFTLRLPNVLAHALYLFTSIQFLLKINGHSWIVLGGFAAININPYLLDFFSLARGYGLCVGLIMASLYFFLKHWQSGHWKWLFCSFAMSFLAVLANFVALNFFVSLWGAVFFTMLFEKSILHIDWAKQLKLNLIPICVSAILGLLLFRPIGYLKGGGEFTFGTDSLNNTFYFLSHDSLYGAAYLGNPTTTIVFFVLASGITIFGLIAAILLTYRQRSTFRSKLLLSMTLLFVISCVVMILQHYLLGSQYLVNRKALFFIPIIGVIWYLLLAGLQKQYPKLAQALSIALLVLAGYHLLRVANLRYCREWKYDEFTKEMVEYLERKYSSTDQVLTLGVNAAFQPTTVFYHDFLDVTTFEPPSFDVKIYQDGRFDYYYVFTSDYPQLQEYYEIEKEFHWGSLLLKR